LTHQDLGAPKSPPDPQRSGRPGAAVAALVNPPGPGRPEMPPDPQRSGRPGAAVAALVKPPGPGRPEIAPRRRSLADGWLAEHAGLVTLDQLEVDGGAEAGTGRRVHEAGAVHFDVLEQAVLLGAGRQQDLEELAVAD